MPSRSVMAEVVLVSLVLNLLYFILFIMLVHIYAFLCVSKHAQDLFFFHGQQQQQKNSLLALNGAVARRFENISQGIELKIGIQWLKPQPKKKTQQSQNALLKTNSPKYSPSPPSCILWYSPSMGKAGADVKADDDVFVMIPHPAEEIRKNWVQPE